MKQVVNINKKNERKYVATWFGTRNEMAIVRKYFGSNKTKYLFRIFINNLKFIKRKGLKTGWYVLQGGIAFLKFRKTSTPMPVSKDVQAFYAGHFWATKSIFVNFYKRFNKNGLLIKDYLI